MMTMIIKVAYTLSDTNNDKIHIISMLMLSVTTFIDKLMMMMKIS